MSNEEEISLEETNRIRKSLGLSLIPIPDVGKKEVIEEVKEVEGDSNGNGNGSGDNISLDETNRIRLSLGLKPISVEESSGQEVGDSGSFKDQDQVAYQNWLEKSENERKLSHQDKVRKKIQEAKERAERRKALEGGRGLADDDSNETKSWIQKFRNKQKELQQRRLQDDGEEEEEEKEKPNAKKQNKKLSYSSKNLSGLKVGHNVNDIKGLNQDTVLILKDADVLNDEENELISSALIEKEKLEENKKLSKGKSKYAYEEDEEDNESKDKFFILDGSEIVTNSRSNESKDVDVKPTLVKQSITLDFNDFDSNSQQNSDYQEAKPIKFKKPKKLKKKVDNKRKRIVDDDNEELPEEDDNDLQNMLSINRRKIQKANKKRRLTPEELAEQLLADKEQEEEEEERDLPNDKRLVVSNTTDFLALVKQNSVEPDEVKESIEGIEEEDNIRSSEPVLESEPIEPISSSLEPPTTLPPTHPQIEASTIAPEEPNLDGGLADVVKLLQTKGVLKKKTAEEIEREHQINQQRDWLRQSEKQRLVNEINLQRQREEERQQHNYDRLSNKDKEEIAQYENKMREKQEAQEAQKRFANYKPDINIEYRDDMGNILTSKEAFKHMSRQFHGTSAGKKRVERQIQKNSELQQKEAESLFQIPTESSTIKKTKPGVRLQ